MVVDGNRQGKRRVFSFEFLALSSVSAFIGVYLRLDRREAGRMTSSVSSVPSVAKGRFFAYLAYVAV
jgi:hypothetical protein